MSYDRPLEFTLSFLGIILHQIQVICINPILWLIFHISLQW